MAPSSSSSLSSSPSSFVTLSTTSKIIYCLPQATTNILNAFINAHLTRFFVQDLCAGVGGICLSTQRFGTLSSIIGSLGLFLDLFLSSIIDNHSSKFSRAHRQQHVIPIIAIAAPLFCFSAAIMFNIEYPMRWIHNVLFLSTSPLMTLSVLFTLLSVMRNVAPLGLAYSALGPILTRDCAQSTRNSLFAYKHMLSLIGNMIGAFLPAIIVYLSGDVQQGNISSQHYRWQSSYMFYLSLLCVTSYWVMCIYFYRLIPTSRLVQPQQPQETHTSGDVDQSNSSSKYTIVPNMKQAFGNRAFTALLLLFVYEAARGILWGGLFPFYLSQVLGLDEMQYEFWGGILNVAGMVLAMIATPVWHQLSVRLGNYRAWLLSYMIQAPVGILLYMCIDVGQQQIYRYFFFFVVLSITGSASGFLLDSIKANAVDYEELRTEERREASFEACWSLFPRYISLFSNAFSFGIVSYYNRPEFENRGEFSMESRRVIAILTSLLPSLTSFVCLFLMYRFPVDDEKHRQVLDAMKKLKDGEPVIDPITNELIKPISSSRASQHDLNVLRHFAAFEIRWKLLGMLNKGRLYRLYSQWQSFIERIIFLFWVSISLACGYSFIMCIVSPTDHSDLQATIYLWLSSVCFTIAFGFHYARVKINPSVNEGLSRFSTTQLTNYLTNNSVSEQCSPSTKLHTD